MAAEDYIDFDDYWEDSRDPYLRDQGGRNYQSLFPPTPGAPKRGSAWTTDDEYELKRRWDLNQGIAELAHYFGRTKNGIIARLEKLGIDPDSKNRSLTLAQAINLQPVKKASPMHANMQHLIALLQKGYTTVEVKFLNAESGDAQGSQTYTYKVPESLAKTLVKGDLLVVPARKAFNVVRVHEVHDTPKINIKEPLALRWIVQKVDTTAYDDQAAREAQAIEQLQTAERRQAQQEALQTLLGSAEDREAFLALINGA